MIDARVQVKEILDSVCDNVKMVYPEGDVELPLITYGQITNVRVGKWQERIEFQVDIYAGTFADCMDLYEDVDEAIADAGFVRTYESADSLARVSADLYKKTLNYFAVVNTHENNILTGGY